jgi:hypothetical protein
LHQAGDHLRAQGKFGPAEDFRILLKNYERDIDALLTRFGVFISNTLILLRVKMAIA